MNNELMSN